MDQSNGGAGVGSGAAGKREERVAEGVSIRRNGAGEPESLRVAFQFRGRECREPLIGLAPTPPNQRYAIRLRGEIINAIAKGAFNYADYFPESKNARLFGFMGSGDTVGMELRAWFKIAKLEGSTRLTYQRVLDGYLYKWFDDVRLRDLSAPMIRSQILDVRKPDGTPVTLKTARNILTPLSTMLELAVGDGKLDHNPMTRLKLERFWPEAYVTSDFEADPFTWAEMTELFKSCQDGELGAEADYWRFAFGTGLRPSEQMELWWTRCDLVQFRVRVEVARVTSGKVGEGRGSAVKGPKTRAGKRDVDCTAGAWEALQRQRARTQLAGEHVWLDPRTGSPWGTEETLRKRFVRICKAAGVRYRNPYQTRHTFASVLLAAGYDPRWVAEQMGHETTEMLERNYGKWIRQGSTDREALAAFFSHVSPTIAKTATFWR